MLGVAAVAAIAAVLVVGRRKVQDLAPPPDYSGSPYPLDVPLRPDLGEAAHARVTAPGWEPPALTALAAWNPPAPRRPLARAAAYVWAAPLTVAGLAAGCLTGVRPELQEGVLVFRNAGGPAGALLHRCGYAAGAIGHVIIATHDPGPRLLAHELMHVRHAERLGILTAPVYLALLAVYGYARHPLERAARRAARRFASEET